MTGKELSTVTNKRTYATKKYQKNDEICQREENILGKGENVS